LDSLIQFLIRRRRYGFVENGITIVFYRVAVLPFRIMKSSSHTDSRGRQVLKVLRIAVNKWQMFTITNYIEN